jgi:hypothetical protein
MSKADAEWRCPKQISLSRLDCLARRETKPFYRSNDMIYNVGFTGASTPYFWTKLILQGSQAGCIIRLNNPKEHDDMLALP